MSDPHEAAHFTDRPGDFEPALPSPSPGDAESAGLRTRLKQIPDQTAEQAAGELADGPIQIPEQPGPATAERTTDIDDAALHERDRDGETARSEGLGHLHSGMPLADTSVRQGLNSLLNAADTAYFTSSGKTEKVQRANDIATKVGEIDGVNVVRPGDFDRDRDNDCAHYAFGEVNGESWAAPYTRTPDELWRTTRDGGSPQAFLQQRGYEIVDGTPVPGDVVAYTSHTAEDIQAGKAAFRHFGVLRPDGSVESKFAQGPVATHWIDHVPSFWGSTAYFMRKRGVEETGEQSVPEARGASPAVEVRALIADAECEVNESCEAAEHTAEAGTEGDALPGEICDRYGYKAVELADALARAAINGDVMTERFAGVLLEAELEAIRDDFAAWDAGLDRPGTDAYYEATGIISHFNRLDLLNLPVTLAEPPSDVDTRIAAIPSIFKSDESEQSEAGTRPDLFTWLASLSDDRLLNYLQWSDARTAAVTEALQTQREEIERNVRDDFENLIIDGLAPESAREALERGIEQTVSFGALNSFESGFYHAAGLYDGITRRLGVMREFEAAEVDKYTRLGHNVVFHEKLHALDFANDMGLTYLLSEDEEPLTWVDEAVKEHLTLSAAYGQSGALDPSKRSDFGAYSDLRELLHLTLTGGAFEIDVRELTAANFESHGTDGHLRQNLAVRLWVSYCHMYPDLSPGETILHVIAREINAAPKPLKSGVVQTWIKKMYEWQSQEYVGESDIPEPTDRAIARFVPDGTVKEQTDSST